MTGARTLLIVLGWPLGEILSLLLMAEAVGAWMTLLLVVLAGLAGILTLRLAGRSAIAELRAEAARGGMLDPAIFLGASRLAIAGILLLIPGFLSDIAALGLLVLTFARGGSALARTGAHRPRRPPLVIDVPVERRGPDERSQ